MSDAVPTCVTHGVREATELQVDAQVKSGVSVEVAYPVVRIVGHDVAGAPEEETRVRPRADAPGHVLTGVCIGSVHVAATGACIDVRRGVVVAVDATSCVSAL